MEILHIVKFAIVLNARIAARPGWRFIENLHYNTFVVFRAEPYNIYGVNYEKAGVSNIISNL